ncbi:MAG: carbohydrate kinase family protein [Candidatus Nanoarchaeia archaeon]
MYDVITFGSATVDVFVKTGLEMISIKHDGEEEEFVAYESGSKILIKDLDFMLGGGGTNTAVSFSRLGLKTAFCGCLGLDENAEHIIYSLKKEKVDFVGTKKEGKSGYSVILDSLEDDRTILAFKGVNDKLQYKEIEKKILDCRWFYFSSLMGESYKTFVKLTDYAKKKGIKVAFNPSSYLAKKGCEYLKKPLKNTYFLILNLEEAQLLVGKFNVKDLLKKISELGPKIVVITNGKEGAYAYDGSYYFISGGNVKVKETTGAGDAFASSFLAGIMLKNETGYALRLASANASSVIGELGAKNNLLTLKDANKKIKNKRVKKLK